jgi:chromosome segregation ATPase
MKLDTKTIVIIILSIALAIVSYIAFKGNSPEIDTTSIKSQLDALKQENDSLISDSEHHRAREIKFEAKIDSLEHLKPKIEYVSEKKQKQIDASNVSGVVSDFNSVFTNSNIK